MPEEYQAYIDGSGTGSSELLVLAGYIATASVWEEFSKAWQQQLDEAGMSYFKMNEMQSKTEFAAWFYRTIEAFDIPASVACAIYPTKLRKAITEIEWPPEITRVEQLANPYYSAFKAIIDLFAQKQEVIGISEPVNFIFDMEGEGALCREGWTDMYRSSNPEIRKRYGKKPEFLDDKTEKPLQAADMLAWWVRKWTLENNPDIASLPFPWKRKKKIPLLYFEPTEADFSVEFQKMIPLARAVIKGAGIPMTLPDPSSPLNRGR